MILYYSPPPEGCLKGGVEICINTINWHDPHLGLIHDPAWNRLLAKTSKNKKTELFSQFGFTLTLLAY